MYFGHYIADEICSFVAFVSAEVILNKIDKMIPRCHCQFLNTLFYCWSLSFSSSLTEANNAAFWTTWKSCGNSFVGAATAAINGFSRTLWDPNNTCNMHLLAVLRIHIFLCCLHRWPLLSPGNNWRLSKLPEHRCLWRAGAGPWKSLYAGFLVEGRQDEPEL